MTGYLITNREANKQPAPPTTEWAWWYQYYFSTERGRLGLENPQYRDELARLVWKFNSPTWNFDDATFERTATAFDNPDYVAIVIHNYRWRLGLAAGDPRYDSLEQGLPRDPSSVFRPSPSTGRSTRSRPPVTGRCTGTSSPAPMRTGP